MYRVLRMAYGTQNHGVYGFRSSSGILNNSTTFLKMELFRSANDWLKTHTLLGPLESINLNNCSNEEPYKIDASLHSPEEGNRSSFLNVLFYSI
jgi:hypothetical protein